MAAPVNRFKARLKSGESQIGLWVGLGDPSAAELCSYVGFDWLVIDGEHGPNELRDVIAQMRAIGPRNEVIVRLRDDDRARIKQVLDAGAQSLLIPMVESAEQARELVRSVRYPPEGVRGMGAGLGRGSAYGSIEGYVATANGQICLLVQVETVAGVAALEEILAVPGVDGVFIGPSDLSADMGYPGQLNHPEVVRAVEGALTRIMASPVAAGCLSFDRAVAERYVALGVDFVAVGSDVTVLMAGLKSLRAAF